MPKKKGKHLQFYMDCMKNDCKIPYSYESRYIGGLCSSADVGLISKKLFSLFSHGQSDYQYWASGEPIPYESKFAFTPLRQTIVLLMACLNNEL